MSLKQPVQAIIISDLHLSDTTPDLMQRFIQLLSTLPNNCKQLYILGDLVDFWPGDDSKDNYSLTIIEALKNLTDAGVETFLQLGNRDFLIGKRFAKKCGVTLLPDYHIAQLANQPVLLMHGDLLCTDDIGYLKMRKVLHLGWVRVIWAILPMFLRLKIILKVQKNSRAKVKVKANNITDANPQAIVDTIKQFGVKQLIHGHTHRPETSEHRIVLGDWGDEYWWVKVTDSAITLEQAPLTSAFVCE